MVSTKWTAQRYRVPPDECDYFITCDDKFIKTIDRNKDKLKDIIGNIKLYNPIDFLRKEMDIDVIE